MDEHLHRELQELIARHRDELIARGEAATNAQEAQQVAEGAPWIIGDGCTFITQLEGYELTLDYHFRDDGPPRLTLLSARRC